MDPRDGGLLLHVGWEALLFLGVLVAGAGILLTEPGLFVAGPIWGTIAYTGLLATGLALSLRAGVPNLAVGQICALSAVVVAAAAEAGWPLPLGAVVALAVGLVVGCLLGLVAGLTSVPAWAASLGVSGGLSAALLAIFGREMYSLNGPGWGVGFHVVGVLLFLLVSIGGGACWQIPALREALSANRAPTDPAPWRPRKLSGALVGMVGSSVLAALAGVFLVFVLRFSTAGDWSHLLLVALAAVLLGGVNARGRRGGIAGTTLATVLLVLLGYLFAIHGFPAAVSDISYAVAILLGLVVGWLLEWSGGKLGRARPRTVPSKPADDWGAPMAPQSTPDPAAPHGQLPDPSRQPFPSPAE